MTEIRDDEGEFDAPIETVWRFAATPALHALSHQRSIRKAQPRPEAGGVVVLAMERKWRGHWVKVINRMTLIPPLGTVTEMLEGPFAGSKWFTVYTAQGTKTRVGLYGTFTSPSIPSDEVSSAAREWFDGVYAEDAPSIKALRGTA